MIQLFGSVLIVIIGSALCSASEAALFSVPLVKVQQLAQHNNPAAKVLIRIRENMSRPIATIVFLNNIFNIPGSIIVGNIATKVLGSQWLGVFSAFLTFAIIIGGEIIPKTFGERHAELIALAVARPVSGLTLLMLPVVWIVERLVSPITRGVIRPVTNESEIKLLAHIGQKEGSIEKNEAALIDRVFHLNDITASDLMTPRVSLTSVQASKTFAEAKGQIIASQHTRILVVGDSIDDVKGIVLKYEVLLALIEGRCDSPISELTRPVRFVPEMVHADQLLATFQTNREHLAVVVDEFGGIAGVVTLEDVLEVLTGEIVDESDRVVDLREWTKQRYHALLARKRK
jgi:CBS domain containing-hemolysin-like protein